MEMVAGVPVVWIWIFAAVALAIGEMATISFSMLPFAIGCAVAAIASLLGAGIVWQLLLFAVVSVICLAVLRPFARKVTESVEPQRSGIDRFVGAQGVVTTTIEPHSSGLVKVGGEEWSAKSWDSRYGILENTNVDVVQVDGTFLVVAPTRDYPNSYQNAGQG